MYHIQKYLTAAKARNLCCFSLLFIFISLNTYGQRPPNEAKYLGKKLNDIEVMDKDGNRKNISEFFGDVPVILSPIYTKCPSSCSVITGSLKDAVNKAGGLGTDYRVLTFSFDFEDEPKDLQTFGKRWKLDENNWEVVSSDEESTKLLLESIDFEVVKDTVYGEYLHPNVVMVISPGMKISRFVYGVFPTARDINMSVLEAKQEKTSLSFYDGLVLNCFRFDNDLKTYVVDWKFVAQIVAGVSTIFVLLFLVIRDSFFKDMDAVEPEQTT
jgi:protein SCO1